MKSVPVIAQHKNQTYLVFLREDGMASINGPVRDLFDSGSSIIEAVGHVKAENLVDAKVKAEAWLEANR